MDIDIDTPTAFKPENYFPGVRACVVKNGDIAPHPCGFYFQEMPVNPVNKLAAIPYDEAEELGFYKIDFLHLGIYDYFESRKQIEEFLEIEPDWNLLLMPSVVEKLFQMSKHADVLNKLKPKSVLELADALALIRPGKKELMGLYMTNKKAARNMLYARDANGYSFKKSHAIAYAMVIVLQLHLIAGGIL